MLQSDPFESLKLESTTRSINIKGPQGVAIESLTGDITATSLQDLTLRSRIGKVTELESADHKTRIHILYVAIISYEPLFFFI